MNYALCINWVQVYEVFSLLLELCGITDKQ